MWYDAEAYRSGVSLSLSLSHRRSPRESLAAKRHSCGTPRDLQNKMFKPSRCEEESQCRKASYLLGLAIGEKYYIPFVVLGNSFR